MNKPYNLFIGRFQSPHKGHQAIFDTYLSKNEPILIAIRNVETDEKNPLSAMQVALLWMKIYEKNDLVRVIIIPDICSVNYGRGVGYDVKEIEAQAEVQAISATEIRKKIIEGDNSWKKFVDKKIHDLLPQMIHEK
jgi:nicotinamide mononucleotide adenylyltransferase